METVQISELKGTMNNYLAREHLSPYTRINAAAVFSLMLTELGIYGGFVFLPEEIDSLTGVYGREGKIKFV